MKFQRPSTALPAFHLGSPKSTLQILTLNVIGWFSLAPALPCLGAESTAATYAAATRAAREANMTAEPVAAGPFSPTWDSLKSYRFPEWFRDAKFGIWAHWSPQGQPGMSDWYARFIYMPKGYPSWARPIYQFHVVRYGHPSVFGYKDVARTWKAERWEPEKLIDLYKRAGAQYFVALANHHDNFDMWDSKYQPWNTTLIGPKQDMIGAWAKATRAAGLKFGVSMHGARAWRWFEPAQGADTEGPLAGVPYDGKLTEKDGAGKWWEGLDPQDLYAQNHPIGAPYSEAYMRKFINRVFDVINKYDVDLLYFDDRVMPFYREDPSSLKIAAHLYNHSIATHQGKNEAVLTSKRLDDEQRKCLVYDIERGRSETILPQPWQTDTCIGEWHYSLPAYERNSYKSAHAVLQMLIDIVSKNGNLLLSIPVRGDGTLDDLEIGILQGLSNWMNVNREAIFATRPWLVYGEGPSTTIPQEKGGFEGIKDVTDYSSADVRFTAAKDGKTLYAILMAPDTDKITIKSLGHGAKLLAATVSRVELLGCTDILTPWSQDDNALTVQSPFSQAPANPVVLKISLK